MSVTDSGNDESITLEGPRVCPECQGFGVWQGDLSDEERIIECVRDDCPTTWTAPNRSEGGDG